MYINITNKPHIIPGYLNGLKQSGLSIEIEAKDPPDFENFKVLEFFLIGTESIRAKYQPEISLIQLFSRFIINIQRINHIYCSEYFFLEEKRNELPFQKEKIFKLILPFVNDSAIKLVLPWSLSFFNNLKFNLVASNDSILSSEAFKDLEIKLRTIRHPSQNHPLLVKAALDLNIPILNNSYDYLALGVGRFSIKFNSTITSNTSPIGIKLVADKLQTSRILHKLGMPAPVNYRVQNIHECVEFAKKLSYPLVIKPQDREQGKGVFANIIDEKTLIKSFDDAKQFSDNILIEKHCFGVGHRLVVLLDRVIRITKKLPLGIVGDGKSTIAELIDEKNKKKSNFYEIFDSEAEELLIQQKLTLDKILDLDQFVPLRRTNNYSRGGSVEAIPIDEVHSDNIELTLRASKLFGLDIAGIDLIIPDIKISWLESEAVICDINAQPQMDPDTIKSALKTLFKKQGRIPLHLIIIDDNKIPCYEKKGLGYAKKLKANGFSTKNGIFIDGKRVSKPMLSCFDASKALLHYSELKIGLSILSLKEILFYGLPLDQYSSIRIDVNESSEEALSDLIKAIKPHTKMLGKI